MGLQAVLTIASLGDGAAPRLYHFGTAGAPTWDSDGVWFPDSLLLFPPEIASEANFRDGNASVGGFSVELRAGSLLVDSEIVSVASLLYDQIPVQVGTLSAALAKAASTITLDSSTLEDTTILIGRECIAVETHLGSNVFDCVKGILGTRDVAHGVEPTDHVSVFLASAGPILRFRRVTLYIFDEAEATSYDTAISDTTQRRVGVLTNISAPEPHLIRIDVDDSLTLLGRRSVLQGVWRSYSRTRSSFQGLGDTAAASGSVAISLGGESAWVDVATRLSSGDAWLPAGTAHRFAPGAPAIGTREVMGSGATSSSLPDSVKQVWEYFPATAGPGASTSSLPLSANIFNLILQVLTTTADGTNGAYDVGVEVIGCAIEADLVDIDAIERVRDSLGHLAWQDTLQIGFDGKPLDVLPWIQRKLLPYACVLMDQGGRLTVVRLSDVPSLTAPTITEDDVVGVPQQIRLLDYPFDEVSVLYGEAPGVPPVRDTFRDVIARRQNIYGELSAQEFDLSGFDIERRHYVGLLALQAVQRYHIPIPQIEITVLLYVNVVVGQVIRITHDKIYRPTGGARGVTSAAMMVIAVREDLEDATKRIRLLDVGALFNGVGFIAPAAVVASWSSPTLTLHADAAAGGFASGQTFDAETDAGGFEVGWIVDLCNPDQTVKEANLEIATISGNDITFTGTPSTTPAAGDVIKFADYDNATAAQKANYAAWADGSPSLGAAGDDAFEWSSGG